MTAPIFLLILSAYFSGLAPSPVPDVAVLGMYQSMADCKKEMEVLKKEVEPKILENPNITAYSFTCVNVSARSFPKR